MYVIRYRFKSQEFVQDKYFNLGDLQTARTFNKESKAKLSVQNRYACDKDDYEIVEVELKIK